MIGRDPAVDAIGRSLLEARYPIGSHVVVAPQYMGSGTYSGTSRTMVVAGYCGPHDLKLARDTGGSWDVITHVSRIVGDPACHWERRSHRGA